MLRICSIFLSPFVTWHRGGYNILAKIIRKYSITNPQMHLANMIGIFFRDEIGCILESNDISFKFESQELYELYVKTLREAIRSKFYSLLTLYIEYRYILDIKIDNGIAYVSFERLV